MNEASPVRAGGGGPADAADRAADGGTTAGTTQIRHPDFGNDLTRGPILKTLLAFSIPTLISNLLQTLNGTINSIWVGRLIGENGLAATGNANTVMFLLFAAVFGFGMATTVRVGQFYGARDIDSARSTFGTGLGFCAIVAMSVGVLGWIFSPRLLHALSTPAASADLALAYLRVVFITMPFGTISMMLAQGQRGVGDSRLPLRCMILTVALDTALNPLLIRGLGPIPGLGIAGSALATAIANLIGALAMIITIYAKDLPLRLRGHELGYLLPRRSELGYVVSKGLPMGAQMLLVGAAGVVMFGLVNREGLIAAAAYSASLQLWNYLQMPAFAISSAVSAMVAQNIGAGNHGRVGRITRIGVFTNLALTLTLASLIVLFSRPLLVLFLGPVSPAVPLARHIQMVCTWSFALTGIMMILTGTMRAYGAVILPLIVMFLAMYPARLGFYFLAYPRLGGEAVWWAYPAGSVVAVSLTWLAYARGGWRNKRHLAFQRPPS